VQITSALILVYFTTADIWCTFLMKFWRKPNLTSVDIGLGISLDEQCSDVQWQRGEEGSNSCCDCLDEIGYDELQLVVKSVEDEATYNGTEKATDGRHGKCPWHRCCVGIEQLFHVHNRSANQWYTYTLHIICTLNLGTVNWKNTSPRVPKILLVYD